MRYGTFEISHISDALRYLSKLYTNECLLSVGTGTGYMKGMSKTTESLSPENLRGVDTTPPSSPRVMLEHPLIMLLLKCPTGA